MGKEREIDYNSHLASVIRDSLHKKRMTQAALAEATGAKPATISTYCNGTRCPDALMLAKIAKALDVSSDYLLGLHQESGSDQNANTSPLDIESIGHAILYISRLMTLKGSEMRILYEEYESMHFPVIDIKLREESLVDYYQNVAKIKKAMSMLPESMHLSATLFQAEELEKLLQKFQDIKPEKEPALSIDYADLPF